MVVSWHTCYPLRRNYHTWHLLFANTEYVVLYVFRFVGWRPSLLNTYSSIVVDLCACVCFVHAQDALKFMNGHVLPGAKKGLLVKFAEDHHRRLQRQEQGQVRLNSKASAVHELRFAKWLELSYSMYCKYVGLFSIRLGAVYRPLNGSN